MSPKTHIITTLTLENKRLREKLSIAEQWIGREVSEIRLKKTKEETMKNTRKGLQESEEEIRVRLQKYLGEYDERLSEINRNLLIESEINFYHSIRNKDLDGLMVTNVYQKILENIFEEYWTCGFREKHRKTRIHPKKNDIIEKTIYKVIHDGFRLSIGKIYQICTRIMENEPGHLLNLYRTYVEETPLYRALNESDFWDFFKDIIETNAFGEKRHVGKISFKDVQFIRESITGNYEEDGLLKILIRTAKTHQNSGS